MQNAILSGQTEMFESFEKIAQLQWEASERIAKSQTAMWSEVLNQSMAHSETLFGQTDVGGWMKANQVFWEDVSKRMQNVTEASVGIFSDTQEKISAIMMSSVIPVAGVSAESTTTASKNTDSKSKAKTQTSKAKTKTPTARATKSSTTKSSAAAKSRTSVSKA